MIAGNMYKRISYLIALVGILVAALFSPRAGALSIAAALALFVVAGFLAVRAKPGAMSLAVPQGWALVVVIEFLLGLRQLPAAVLLHAGMVGAAHKDLGEVVASAGLIQPQRGPAGGLAAMHKLTPVEIAEMAIGAALHEAHRHNAMRLAIRIDVLAFVEPRALHHVRESGQLGGVCESLQQLRKSLGIARVAGDAQHAGHRGAGRRRARVGAGQHGVQIGRAHV